MDYSLVLWGLALLFFLLLMIAMRIGHRVGRKRGIGGKESPGSGAKAIEATIFALLGLLVAFTFSGAAQRMAERRNLIVQEVNAIGTAWLRIDLLNSVDQPAMRENFRRYVDARLDYYRHLPDFAQRDAIAARVSALQKETWSAAAQAIRNTSPPFAVSFIGALNDMLDAQTTLTVTQQVHPPMVTYLFLGALVLVCGFLVGLNLADADNGDLFQQVIYALVMTAALYIIVDFEFPRVGTIRIDQADALLQSVRNSMGVVSGAAR